MPQATRASRPPSARAAKSGSSQPPSTIASTPTPIRNGLAATIDWYLRACGPEQGATCSRPGARFPDPDCCVPGDPQLPGQEPRGDLRLSVLPGRRRAAEVRRQGGLSRSRLRLRGRAVRHRRRRMAQSISARAPATCASAPRPARWACANFPIRVSTRRSGSKLNGSLASWDGYRKPYPTKPDKRGFPRQRACSTARSSRRSASAWRAAPATSPTIRCKPPADPNNPKWENIDGLVGNQFSRISQLLGSGMSHASARMATDRARAARHGRHVGAADGHRVEPRHHERDHQLRQPSAARRIAC